MSTRLPAAARRAQLLDVALSIFGTSGFHDASMQDVATAAGVTKPVLYQHFSSKEELFAAVASTAADRLRERSEKALSSAASAREQVESGIGAVVDLCTEEPSVFRVLFGESARSEPRIREIVTSAQRELAQTIASHMTGVADDDPALALLLSHSLIGLSESAIRYWLEEQPDVSVDLLRSQVIELAWAGLRGSRPAT